MKISKNGGTIGYLVVRISEETNKRIEWED